MMSSQLLQGLKWISTSFPLFFPLLLLSGCSGGQQPPVPDNVGKTTPSVDPVYRQAQARQNDTGIVFSGNHPRSINENCIDGVIDDTDEWLMGEQFAELRFRGQDCQSGRDFEFADDADGHAGFSFVKIAADGSELPADAAEWHCVLDKVTGLMWEVKSAADDIQGNGGPHDADDVFMWYNTDTATNGGHIGNWNRDGADCYGYENGNPASFCNTQAFAERANQTALCSYSDWRIPSVRDLISIVNFGRNQPAVDLAYFRARTTT